MLLKKRILKGTTSLFLFLAMFCSFISPFVVHVSAYNLYGNGNVLVGGVGNSGNNTRHYWLNTYATNNYTTPINQAMYSWNHTSSTPGVTTPIWFTPVEAKKYSVMDIYAYSSSNDQANGVTYFFLYYYDETPAIPSQNNWRWCKIALYGGNFGNNLTTPTGITFRSTTAHEMGHVFGLNENNGNHQSIMCQAFYRNPSVLGPIADDCNGINALY